MRFSFLHAAGIYDATPRIRIFIVPEITMSPFPETTLNIVTVHFPRPLRFNNNKFIVIQSSSRAHTPSVGNIPPFAWLSA